MHAWGVYPFVVELMYILQVKSGLKTFDEKEQKDLNIKNLGQFEFVKDENSNEEIIEIKISDILYKTFISSKKWNYAFENKALPLIKQYERKLGYEEDKNKNIQNKIKNKEMTNNNTLKNYNDVNFWEIKSSIPIEVKNKINKNKEIIKNNNNEIDVNKPQNTCIDEEDELLGISMKLEAKEIQPSSNSSSSVTKSNKIISKNIELSNDVKLKEKQNILKIKNKKNITLPKFNKKKVLTNLKLPSKIIGNKFKLKVNVNKDKKENNNYNDINFWKINTETLLNKKDIDEIFDYL